MSDKVTISAIHQHLPTSLKIHWGFVEWKWNFCLTAIPELDEAYRLGGLLANDLLISGQWPE